jgi:hypothetical protein
MVMVAMGQVVLVVMMGEGLMMGEWLMMGEGVEVAAVVMMAPVVTMAVRHGRRRRRSVPIAAGLVGGRSVERVGGMGWTVSASCPSGRLGLFMVEFESTCIPRRSPRSPSLPLTAFWLWTICIRPLDRKSTDF